MKQVGALGEQKAVLAAQPEVYLIFVAIDDRYAGSIAIADPVKKSAAQALRELKAQGIHLVMLTGDNPATAQQIARSLGIDDFKAEGSTRPKSRDR